MAGELLLIAFVIYGRQYSRRVSLGINLTVGAVCLRSHEYICCASTSKAERQPVQCAASEAKALLRKMAQPKWVAPMLATLTRERFSREGWLFEPKWDGERCIAVRRGRKLSLFSRNRILLNARYPEVASALDQEEATSFIVDGEIVTSPCSGMPLSIRRALSRAPRRTERSAQVPQRATSK